MRALPILLSLALTACMPALTGRPDPLGSGDYLPLLSQSELAALWAGPALAQVPTVDLSAGLDARLAALRARAAILRALAFDNSALQ